jgi:flagellar hook-length control protein FliK
MTAWSHAVAGADAPAVRTPVGQPGFAQDFSSQILVLARGATHTAQLSLHPAELGPVSISIQMTGQQAIISMQATHESTREAIRQALPQLHEMFRSGGLELTQAQVGDGSPGQGWREAPQQRPGQPARNGPGSGAAGVAGEIAAAPVPAAPGARSMRIVDAWA